MLSLISRGTITTKKHLFPRCTALPNPVMWFIQPWRLRHRCAHSHTQLPFLHNNYLPRHWGGDSPVSGRCPVLQGEFWNVWFCEGTTMTILSACSCEGCFVAALDITIPLQKQEFQPLENSQVRRNAQTQKTLAHTLREAEHHVFCQKTSRISCFPSLGCNFTFMGQVFHVPGNMELSISDFSKDLWKTFNGLLIKTK